MSYKKIMILLIVAPIFFAACSNAHRSREQEKKALQLLGNAGGGTTSVTCKSAEFGSQANKIFTESLIDKNIAASLFETARQINKATKDCSESAALFMVTQNPAIDQVIQILGKEDSTEVRQVESNTGNMSVTLYKYSWLGFGVAEDKKVVLMAVDFKKSGL